jgi:spermine oxidase
VQAVARALAEMVDVRYHHTVTSIAWGAQGVSVSCSNGERFTADAAVVTVSLGVLKTRHHELFAPPLPAPKLAAIGRLEIGVVDKVFLEFEVDAAAAVQDAADGSGRQVAPFDISEEVIAYALLWDAEEARGASDGSSSNSSTGASVSTTNGSSKGSLDALPRWIRGIFSVRFGGAEFKRRSQQQGSTATEHENGLAATHDSTHSNGHASTTRGEGVHLGGAGGPMERAAAAQQQQQGADTNGKSAGSQHHAPGGSTSAQQEQQQQQQREEEGGQQGRGREQEEGASRPAPSAQYAVIWLTGREALEMERASDAEVLAAVRAIPTVFPGIVLPPGASWDRMKMHR